MPQITTEIPQQKFELIRDRVGAILLDEFAGQFAIHDNDQWVPSTVDIERFVPIDEQDFPLVNVSVVTGLYDNYDTSGNSRGTYQILIDVFTGSPESMDVEGDQRATINLQRIIGVIRYIFADPVYKTLLYDPREDGIFINNTKIVSWMIGDPSGQNGGINFIWGRVVLEVESNENETLKTPRTLEAIGIRVNLAHTDNYYFWSIGSGVVPISGKSMDRSVVLYIKDNPDESKLIAVGNGQFIQEEYAPGDTLMPAIAGAEIGYLSGKLIYRPAFYNDTAFSLLRFDVALGIFDRTTLGGFNDGDFMTFTFLDYE